MNEILLAHRAAGQSIWYDNIERGLVRSGGLRRLMIESGVVGVTSNPSIFEKAIAGSSAYDEPFRELVADRSDVAAIYEALTTEDIREAADVLRDVHRATHGIDGYVSFEVSPRLARDSRGSVEEAKRLWSAIGRPNVMIKIPATSEGIVAVRELTAAGIPVNVTLIFSQSQYEDVAEAYIKGCEERLEAGESLSGVTSVASFFVSRIDTVVDGRLPESSPLRGKAAIANSKIAFARHLDIFGGERWLRIAGEGGSVQRMLWASTSTKNPAYPATTYVDELIGPNTVNTIPPSTLKAFLEQGSVRPSLTEDLPGARKLVEELARHDIDLETVGEHLQEAGVTAFAKAFDGLLECISLRRQAVLEGDPRKASWELGALGDPVKESLANLAVRSTAARIWSRDPSVWKEDPEHLKVIANRLGWLDVVSAMRERIPGLRAFADDARQTYRHAILLGMGGSSLCPEVLRKTFGVRDGFIDVNVLDSTDPAAVKAAADAVDLSRTLFIVASKSGGTTEVQAFHSYFDSRAEPSSFIAITDSGTALEQLAREKGFRQIFTNPPDIGGRYSALSLFGLVPAALLGVDLEAFLDDAVRMMQACGSCVSAPNNPGIKLGSAIGEAALRGRDKLTLLFSPDLSALGSWVEQLVAESTGKEGLGVVPVDGEPIMDPAEYGKDRLFVYTRCEGNDDDDRRVKALEDEGHPVIRFQLDGLEELGGEFYRWEMGTAVAGAILGIDPFDEPNVKESKDRTKALLDDFEESGSLDQGKPLLETETVALWADGDLGVSKGMEGVLASHVARLAPGDFFAVLAYLQPTATNHREVEAIRHAAVAGRRMASTSGFGPRFLHSTGQLHKGGANRGVFLQITADDVEELPIPGWSHGFGVLKLAQAIGDFESLCAHGRRVVRVHIKGDVSDGIAAIAAALEGAGR